MRAYKGDRSVETTGVYIDMHVGIAKECLSKGETNAL